MVTYLTAFLMFLAAGPVRVLALADAVAATAPRYLDAAEARDHALAAVAAERPHVPAELLLGMAWVESRYTPDATSRVVDGRRRTGRWRSTRPAGVGPRFCGVVQAQAGRSWARCLQLRDVRTGYAVGADELTAWRRVCRRMRAPDLTRCMLDGHGGGVKAARRGTTYGPRVLERVRLIRAAARSCTTPRSSPTAGRSRRGTSPCRRSTRPGA